MSYVVGLRHEARRNPDRGKRPNRLHLWLHLLLWLSPVALGQNQLPPNTTAPVDQSPATNTTPDPGNNPGLTAPPLTGPPKPDSWTTRSANWIVTQQDLMSQRVFDSATAIDRYVAKEAFDDSTINASYVRLRNRWRLDEGGERKFETKFKLKLDLPNARRNVKLLIDSDPNDFDSLEDISRDINIGSDSVGDNDERATGGLRFESSRGEWERDFDIGSRFRIPLDPYTRLRFRRYDQVTDIWQSRFQQTFFYFDSSGWGADSELDLYRPVQDDQMLISNSSAKFLDSDNNWEFLQAFSFYERLSSYNALVYQVAGVANSRPDPRITNYWVRAEWQHRLFSDWLYLKVSPELAFPRENDYSATASLTFELEIFFSRDPELRNIRIRDD